MEKIKVLLVEDDELASELVCDFLQNNGFEVLPVFTATDSISHISIDKFDVVLLDINLPDYDGYEVLRGIASRTDVPVIVTSAYSDTPSKLKAFQAGADDYMVKPIDLEELEARIWLQLKRRRCHSTAAEEKKPLFRIENGRIFFQERVLELTTTEYDILYELIRRKKQAVSREELLDRIASVGSNRLLDNHIKNIRKKIGDNGSNAHYIKTVYGVGYMLAEG